MAICRKVKPSSSGRKLLAAAQQQPARGLRDLAAAALVAQVVAAEAVVADNGLLGESLITHQRMIADVL
jgi:hypothetical protein